MFGKRRVYLDYASAAPVSRRAFRAYLRAAKAWGNPSSPHEEGRHAREILEEARTSIARLIEVRADDIIFTSGATEANNLAIRGVVRPGSHVLYLPSAHPSIVESVRALEGVVAEPLPLLGGKVDIDALTKRLRPTTALISIEAVCGETGTIWNTREVSHAVHEFFTRSGPGNRSQKTHTSRALIHVDASQAPLSEKITRAHFAADLLTLDAQKVGGMRGIGALIAPSTLALTPLIVGGGQERSMRSGTPVPALAAAFAAALNEAAAGQERFRRAATTIRKELLRALTTGIKTIYINEGAEAAPHILNASLPGRDTDYLVALLDEAGFAVSTRSACETDSQTGSRAVFALTGDLERAKTTLRVSWGAAISRRKLLRFAAALARAVQFIDNTSPKSHY